MPEINYLRHHEIHFGKWDRLVSESAHARIYGYSWYLDCLTDGRWDALVLGDYEAVFPLPYKKKWGISYIYQPYFCQQLGLMARPGQVWNQDVFLEKIPRKFKIIHLQLNGDYPLLHRHRLHPDYVLDLGKPYEELRRQYKHDALKNLKKSDKKPVEYLTGIEPNLILEWHRQTWGSLNAGIGEADYRAFTQACLRAAEHGMYYPVAARLDGQFLGGAIFIRTPAFLHYLVSGPTPEGRKLSIMHGIVDHAIRTHAGTSLKLDFEGSRIPAVADFYEKWGSERTEYPEIRIPRKGIRWP